ncbi:molybdate transport system substrate-binding protein [Lutimaribacter pacificus]|uniref:Molybdate-binding protein ModA n=1 Tax=Lutimaribacter pacificus TaxID=391948 RepID=A0A1H0FAR6_9RHOB|nr:molybdate ABC transporter substrate-binding protein [Lutimaribacter pacificus]SDN91768.1 molybdate transport system substrate-binding protein [Lutimaribacter pacificus]SHK46921.1 molybdate transport system substrate-binding protein [Lutimaribacter pacificus]
MKNNVWAAALLCLASAIPARAEDQQVTVFAAASLTTALTEIGDRFGAETGIDVVLSFAGSSALARQIESGAPADIFISANPGWMDRIEESGLVEPGSRRDLLRNALVLVAHDAATPAVTLDGDTDLAAMLGQGRLAMALVDAVPAGIYGKAALTSLGLWDRIEPQVAQADNVRAALALVATGAAPLGIVYATDAVAEPRVTVIAQFPGDSHPPILYPVADLTTRDTAAEDAFLTYLGSDAARAVFGAQGFGVIGE